MNGDEHSEDIIDTLAVLASERGLTLLIIGAHALAELGVARQTFDLDLMIADSDQSSLGELLREQGYVSVDETENFQRFSSSDPDRLDVDVLFVDPPTFKQLAANSTSLGDSSALRVPSILHFLALKLHAIRNNPKREARDLGDIAELLRANPGAVAASQLEDICRTHGPEGVYSSLKDLT